MKRFTIMLLLAFATFAAKAQSGGNVYRNAYIRFGIASLGNALDNNLSPKDNVFKGNYGAGTGYALDYGHIFYFGKKSQKINYGLDWTIISLTYNKMNGWNAYATAAGQSPDDAVGGTKIAASIATKIGPVISFNPVEKLVIDVHAQVAPAWRYFDLDYEENSGEASSRSFAFADYGKEDADQNYDADAVKNRIAFGIAGNFGITVRRGIIGLSLDYFTGKTNTNYDANEKTDNEIHGKAKIPAKSLQIKLGLNF